MGNTRTGRNVSNNEVAAYAPLTSRLLRALRDNLEASRYLMLYERPFPHAGAISPGDDITANGRLYVPDHVIGANGCDITVRWSARNFIDDGISDISQHYLTVNGTTYNEAVSRGNTTTTETTYTYTGTAGLIDWSTRVVDWNNPGSSLSETVVIWVRMELNP